MPSAIQRLFEPEIKTLGGFHARRGLSQDTQHLVGPFIFFDHLGPTTFLPGKGVSVRPHPHVNLATFTYWTIQTWVALPDEHEETEPSFQRYAAEALPQWEEEGAVIRVITGQCRGRVSPVQTFSPTLYLDIQLKAGARFDVPADYSERAIYSFMPGLFLEEHPMEQHRLAILEPGQPVAIRAQTQARCVIIGGEPVGQRIKWWNFASSRPERIKLAKKDWKEKQFTPVFKDTEFIPLLEHG